MNSISQHAPPSNPQSAASSGGGTPITINHEGKTRTAGFAMPGGIWYRRMDRSRHFYRAGGEAIAASRPALAEARRLGCNVCRVVDSESGDTYLCHLDDYGRYGRPIQRLGWEPQVALNLDHWTVIRKDGTQIQPVQDRAVAPEQMNLFQAVTE